MDKYNGVNRPETVYVEMRYQTIERKDFEYAKPRQKIKKTKSSNRKEENFDGVLSGFTQTSLKKNKSFSPESSSKNKYKRVFTVVRYAACLLLLAVCLMGKFTDFKPATEASDYIKTELERDITQEIIDK